MTTKIQPFLIDLLGALEPFKDVIAHVMMREKDGRVMAAAKARDGSISVQATSRGEVPEFTEKACLGSLPYLRGVLTSPLMEGGKIELSYGTASNGSDEVLRSMKMKGKGRLNVYYQAMDPFINQLNRIKLQKTIDWPLAFAVDQTFIDNFGGAVKLSALAPKTNTEMDDLFNMVYTEEGIEGVFGDKHHQTTILLADTVEAMDGTDKTNAYFNVSKIRPILRFIGKGSAVGFMSSDGIRIDTETEQAEYQFVTASRKVRHQT